MSEVRTYAMHVLLDRPWHVKIDYLSDEEGLPPREGWREERRRR